MINNIYKELDNHFEVAAYLIGEDMTGTVEQIGFNNYSKSFGAYYLIDSLSKVSSFDYFKGLIQSGFFSLYIPEMNSNLFKIPQDKQYGKTLGDHLILTILAYNKLYNYISITHDSQVIALSCILHDIGKVYDVNNHAKIGADIACKFSIKYNSFFRRKIESCTDIYNIILHHMRPLGYQRGEKWSDLAVEKFIIDCGGKEQALLTVSVAMCDKYASTQNINFLERLLELCDRIIHTVSQKECVS